MRRLVVLVLFLLLPTIVHAEETPSWARDGAWNLRIELGAGLGDETEVLGLAALGAGVFLADDLELVVDLRGMGLTQEGDDALIGGPSAMLRYYAWRWEDLSLFAEGGAGMAWASTEVPATGTAFNFTPQVGLGLAVPFSERLRATAALRLIHFSNAGLWGGGANNAGVESLGLYLGLAWD